MSLDWSYPSCGHNVEVHSLRHRMTVVRTGKKGYCKQSYNVRSRWCRGQACGAPGA
ncbi:hypothetical protein GCM10023217_34840 [Gordonia alkaliphila]|uniref:Uncharacterized protein n=1 Tax=Gordonia alkaliphila TaxID=1053547 RepID=A0ABP8ZLR1_9ACTN